MKIEKHSQRNGILPVSLATICLLLILICPLTEAASSIANDLGCQSCISSGNVVCRPTYYDRSAYCCDTTELGTRSCGGQGAFCTSNTENPLMRAFACPYSYNYCGASSSEIVMHPTRRNNIAVEISNRLFIDSETCYYTFSVPTSDLDTEKMRYFWDVEISKNTNVDIIINNGTSYETGGDSIQVSFSTGYKFQYFAENNNIYVSFTANVPSTSTT